MKPILILGVAVAAISLASVAVAGPEFLAYQGRNGVHEGQGGEMKTVGGIDFWVNGSPPRKFVVLGSLSDDRHKTGLYGLIRMSGLESDIAKAAKAVGGDAVIFEGAKDDVVGVYSSGYASVSGYAGWGSFNGSGFTSAISRPIEQHQSAYIVVRYLPDDTPVPVQEPPPRRPDPPVAISVHP